LPIRRPRWPSLFPYTTLFRSEAGFAIASPGDFAAVKTIADTIQDSTVCSLARAVDADIERAAEALKGANSGRIHTFIATSPIHRSEEHTSELQSRENLVCRLP